MVRGLVLGSCTCTGEDHCTVQKGPPVSAKRVCYTPCIPACPADTNLLFLNEHADACMHLQLSRAGQLTNITGACTELAALSHDEA